MTRWITHFCAPVFAFLTGTSAWLYLRNTACTRGDLRRFLLTRGLWLVFLELTVVNLAWQFDWYAFLGVQVIWALGWSMVFLALLIGLPLPALATIGLGIVAGHNLLDGIDAESFGSYQVLWALLHQPLYWQAASGMSIGIAYPLVPWIGVTVLGYAFGALLELSPQHRRRWLNRIAFAAVAAFVLLRFSNLYGDPHPWVPSERGTLFTALGALNTTKYPPSLLYLLMTLGPALWLLPRLEHCRGRFASVVSVVGRVPLFFYLLHLPVIHAAASLWTHASFGAPPYRFFMPSDPLPSAYEPSLLGVYLVWIAVMAALYPACRWYAGYRERVNAPRWLSYL